MEQIKDIIKKEILTTIDCLDGFSIFKYNHETYDIYIPTETIEAFYFVSYKGGNFFDLYSRPVSLSNFRVCQHPTQEIIEKNYSRVLSYSDIFIEEHDMLNYGEYKSPKETGAEEYLNMGFEAFEIGDYEEAYNNYTEAIDLKPYDHSLYTARAKCFVKSKQYNHAIADLCRAGISNPISKQNIFTFTFEDIGNVYRIANDFQNSIKFYTLVFNNTGQWWILQKRAACYSALGAFNLAAQDLESILQEERKIEILIELGETYIKGGIREKAKNVLNEVINFHTDSNEEWIVKMLESRQRPIKERAKKLLEQL